MCYNIDTVKIRHLKKGIEIMKIIIDKNVGWKNKFLSRNEINQLLQIMGNFSCKGEINMKDVIHVLYLFEDKDKTKKESEEILKILAEIEGRTE